MTDDDLADDTFDAILAKVVAPTARPHVLAPGTVVAERFRIERLLGAGGMGTVYVARDESLARDVAIKLHHVAGGSDRLRREAVAMAQLSHPNVVAVYEVGELDDHPFVVMEYIAGTTLRDWLKPPTGKPRRSVREIVDVLVGAAEGLAASHAVGLVHRDFKPENVLIGGDGRPRVGDFGLARTAGDGTNDTSSMETTSPGGAATIVGRRAHAATADTTPAPDGDGGVTPGPSGAKPDSNSPTDKRRVDLGSMTATGTVLGTPAYMPPEQLAGEPQLDARVDQFAFCVTAWEALYGARPFSGRTLGELEDAIATNTRTAPPKSAPRVPAAIRGVLDRGLALAPGDRFADMRALIVALRRAVGRRRRRVMIAVGAAALVAGGFGVAFAMREAPPPDCAAEAAAYDVTLPETALAAARARGDAMLVDRLSRVARAMHERVPPLVAEACKHARIAHDWRPGLEAKSAQCIGDDVAEMRILLATAQPENLTASSGLAIVNDLATCARTAHLETFPDVAPEPAKHAQLLHARMVANTGYMHAFAHDDAAADADLALMAAEPAHAEPEIVAALALVRGAVELHRGDLDHAIKHLADGYYAARAADDDRAAAHALQELIQAQLDVRRDPGAAETWVRTAIADAARVRVRSPDVAGALLMSVARFEIQTGDDDGAIEHARAAREIDPSNLDVDLVEGQAACDRGDILACKQAYDHLLGQMETFGVISPAKLLEQLADYMNTLRIAGATDDALAIALRAAPKVEHGDDADPDVANTRAEIGAALHEAHRDAEATVQLDRARASIVATEGEHSTGVADVDRTRAAIAIDAGDAKRAVAIMAGAIAIDDEMIGKDELETAEAVVVQAAAELAAGDLAGARAAADRAVAIYAAKGANTEGHRRALAIRAAVANAAGDPDTALATTATALAKAGVGAETRARTEVERAKALIATKHPDDAKPLLVAARDRFTAAHRPERAAEAAALLAKLR